MYILAIETTGKLSSASLLDQRGNVIGSKVSSEPMSHLRTLVPMISRLLNEAGIKKTELSFIASSVGPGSFTGIRIGVSTARALCQSLGVQAVSVPTLDSFLYKKEVLNKKPDEIACAIINARRGQVYGIIEEYMAPRACMIGDVLDIIKTEIFPAGKKVIFFGDGIDAYDKKIEEELSGAGDYSFAEEESRYQDAASAGAPAYEKVQRGETIDFGLLLPEYMRKAEAEQKLEAGELPICKGPKQE